MSMIEIFGYFGGICFALCCAPQAYKTYKTNDTKSLSSAFIVLSIMGNIFMFSYALLNGIIENHWMPSLFLNYVLNFGFNAYLAYKKIEHWDEDMKRE